MFDNLLSGLPIFVRVAIALFDYMVKASINYRNTAEGAAEWEDVTSLYEEALNNPDGAVVGFSVQSKEDAASDTSVARTPRQPRRVVE